MGKREHTGKHVAILEWLNKIILLPLATTA